MKRKILILPVILCLFLLLVGHSKDKPQRQQADTLKKKEQPKAVNPKMKQMEQQVQFDKNFEELDKQKSLLDSLNSATPKKK